MMGISSSGDSAAPNICRLDQRDKLVVIAGSFFQGIGKMNIILTQNKKPGKVDKLQRLPCTP